MVGSVPFSLIYLTMRRRSKTFPDFAETTGSSGGSPEIAQKNMVVEGGERVMMEKAESGVWVWRAWLWFDF